MAEPLSNQEMMARFTDSLLAFSIQVSTIYQLTLMEKADEAFERFLSTGNFEEMEESMDKFSDALAVIRHSIEDEMRDIED